MSHQKDHLLCKVHPCLRAWSSGSTKQVSVISLNRVCSGFLNNVTVTICRTSWSTQMRFDILNARKIECYPSVETPLPELTSMMYQPPRVGTAYLVDVSKKNDLSIHRWTWVLDCPFSLSLPSSVLVFSPSGDGGPSQVIEPIYLLRQQSSVNKLKKLQLVACMESRHTISAPSWS